ncbi:Hexaprenyldihydroxybenzoate methyltransferase, mitochondrial [Microbotryomycetes sp. JL201]|nr:Hexaprenyldihydroxybenzoate methyltransferase, mitochondrial [Microbotryomycetes sp. JL201]
MATTSHQSAPVSNMTTVPALNPSAGTAATGGRASSSPYTTAAATNTISQDEIAHFTRLSQHWWDPTGEFALLHRMNKVRVRFVKESALRHEELPAGSRWLHGKDVLDVGCGGGIFAEALSRLGANTLAIDAAEQNIKVAQTHAAQDPSFVNPNTQATSCSIGSNLLKAAGVARQAASEASSTSLVTNLLEYRHCAAEDLVKEKRQFDYVCAMEVIEHVEDPAGFLDCLRDLTKPGGLILLSTISRTVLARFLTITVAEQLLRFVEPGTHTYHKYIKPEEMQEYFEQHGWTDLEQRGCIYDPLKAQWRLFGMGEWSGMTELANYFYVARKPLEP